MNTQDELVTEITRQIQNCSAPLQAKISLQNIEFNFVLNFGEVVKALQTTITDSQVFDRFFEIAADGKITVRAMINVSNCTFSSPAFFCDCTFNRNTEFDECIFLGNANFDNSTFNHGVHFRKSLFDNGASFEKCLFNLPNDNNHSAINCVSFPNTNMRATVSFDGSVVNLPVRFVNDDSVQTAEITLGNIQLTNCTFNNSVWIANRTFTGTLNLSGSKFNDVFQFENCKLQEIDQENADKIHNENWNIKLRNVEFKRLVVTGNQIKDAIFENVNVASFANFAKTKFEKLLVENLSLEKGGNFLGMVVTTPLTRQTSRLFKHYALEVDDRITANGFYAQEMVAYETELNENRWRNIGDLIILNASKWSTNFGQSWFRGVRFTCMSGLLFILLSELFSVVPCNTNDQPPTTMPGIEISSSQNVTIPTNRHSHHLKSNENAEVSNQNRIEINRSSAYVDASDILSTPARWLNKFRSWFLLNSSARNERSNFWGLCFDIMGRIVVLYGAYQTIQAFRKLRF